MESPLQHACGLAADPQSLCVRVFNATHNRFLASSSDWLIAKPFAILVIVVVALLVRAVADRTIRRVVRGIASGQMSRGLLKEISQRTSLPDISPLGSERRRQRAETIGSVLHSAVGAIILTVALLTILGGLKVNLAPILASAGVLGLALGFGAQYLVRDFLSGLFFILEDAYGVGDVVDLGPASGTVESVGLRSTHLRDERGVLWHVRNGEILRVGNTSQGESSGVIDLVLPHGADLNAAQEALTVAADRVWEEQGQSIGLVGPPTVLGVQDVAREGVTLRVVARRRADALAADRTLRLALISALTDAGIELATA